MNFPRVSWHIGDYLRDTGHLRAAGHGAYFMLCMHYYAKGSLPTDDKQLAAIARMSDKEWRKHKPVIQAFFQDGWRHKRIEKEIREANERYDKRAAAGSKGGNAKANGKQKPSNATSELDDCQPDAKPMLKQPITLEEREDKTANAASIAKKYAFQGEVIKLIQKHFDAWTKAYPQIDLLAELTARDAWLASERATDADRKNWFISTAKYLANRNMEARAKSQGPRKPSISEMTDQQIMREVLP